MVAGRSRQVQVVGWREWVALPDLGVSCTKAKVDTGARTSALHAFDVEDFERDGERWARFEIHPNQRTARGAVLAEAKLVDLRPVRSSSGRAEHRWVIETTIELAGERWPVEVTLTRRDAMGFRMLVGRQALRRRFVVDPGRSWVGGRPATVRPSEVRT